MLVVVLVSAVFDSLAAVAGDSYIQQATPDRMRGRVFGAVVAFGVLAFGFAGAKTPWLEDATPPTG